MSSQDYKSILNIDAHATGLPSKDTITKKSDPYLVIKIPTQVLGDHNVTEDGKGDKRSKKWKKAAEYSGHAAHIVIAEVLAPVLLVIAVPLAAGSIGGKIIKHASKNHTDTPGFQEVYSSPVIKRDLNPTWPTFQLAFHDAYVHSPHSKLLIECWDYDKGSSSDYIGYCFLSVQDLISCPEEHQFQLLDKEGNPSGQLFLTVKLPNAPNQDAIAAQVQQVQNGHHLGMSSGISMEQQAGGMPQNINPQMQPPASMGEYAGGVPSQYVDPNIQMHEPCFQGHQQGGMQQYTEGASVAQNQQQFDFDKHLKKQHKHAKLGKIKDKAKHKFGGGAPM